MINRCLIVSIAVALGIAGCSQSRNSTIPPLSTATKLKTLSTSAGSTCKLETRTFGPSTMFPDLAVAGASETDAWSILPGHTGALNAAKVSIYHYNGSAWSLVPTPSGGYSGWHDVAVASMTAIASNDVWAVGSGKYPSTGGVNTTPLVLHWNGSRWLYFRNPPSFKSGIGADLQQVSADSSSDVWVAGIAGTPSATYLARWNGSSWSEVSTTIATGGVSSLKAFGPNDVWFISPGQAASVFHWDGVRVRAQALPPLKGTLPSFVLSLAGTSSTDLWVGGRAGASQQITYIAHHSATWSPFEVISAGEFFKQLLAFRRDYALATEGGVPAALLVYNGVNRWLPTMFDSGSLNPDGASVTKIGTKFWASYNDVNIMQPPFANFAALTVCPPNPPPPDRTQF